MAARKSSPKSYPLMRLYHVTDASSVEKILKGGFKPTDGDFGRGVYFWDSLEYAQKFLRGGGNWGYQSPVILEVEAPSGAAKHVDSSSIHAVTMLAEVEPEEEEDLLDLWEHTLLVRTAKAYKPAIVRVIGHASGRASTKAPERRSRTEARALSVAGRLARVIERHTDGKGIGISYNPFEYRRTDEIPLPSDFVAALHAAGFSFNPRDFDGTGWRRYVTKDGKFTVVVEGWGDHCMSAKDCALYDFQKELNLRLQKSREPAIAVLWSSKIPLSLYEDREGNPIRPLKFKAVSFVVLEGSRPMDPDDPVRRL